MHLVASERIKLFSIATPWVCGLFAVVALTAPATLTALTATESRLPPTVASTQFGYQLGLVAVLLLGALAVTSEYHSGTIHGTFQAVPGRTPALVAKAAVVAGYAVVIGETAGFLAWLVARVLAPDADLALDSVADWTIVAGNGPVYAVAAVCGVGVGLLVRHTAGAVALLVGYPLMAENVVQLIPRAGQAIHRWLPLNAVTKFLSGTGEANAGRDGGNATVLSDSPLSPGWALAYFGGFAVLLLVAGITKVRRRDA
jgi:ABC-2 type transport system permease protein